MTNKHRVLICTLASAMLLLGFILGLRQQVQEGPSASSCARTLGIHYTPEDGVTERLTDFARCMEGKDPLGTALQREAGEGYEVIFDPSTGIFLIEPN